MQPRAVLVGVDGSSGAMLAVRWAAAEAARREAPLRLVFAFAWPPAALRRRGGQEQMHRDVLLTAAGKQLDVAAAAAVRDEPGLDVQLVATGVRARDGSGAVRERPAAPLAVPGRHGAAGNLWLTPPVAQPKP